MNLREMGKKRGRTEDDSLGSWITLFRVVHSLDCFCGVLGNEARLVVEELSSSERR